MLQYLLDTFLLDSETLDGVPSSSPVTPTDSVYYANFGLQNANVVTQYVRCSPSQLNLSERGFPRADGEYAEYAYYQRTLITIAGVVTGATQAAMEATMDQLKQALAARAGTFAYTFAGVTRFFDGCYPLDIEKLFDKRDFYHVTFCPFEIQLVCIQPYARLAERDSTSMPYLVTGSPDNFIINNQGTAPTNSVLEMVMIAAGTLSQLVFTNATTGEVMTIVNNFNPADELIIDGEAKTVMLNTIPIDYVGVFPTIQPGNNSLVVTATGSGYQIAFTEQHFARFL